jgi:hypothetical protein
MPTEKVPEKKYVLKRDGTKQEIIPEAITQRL